MKNVSACLTPACKRIGVTYTDIELREYDGACIRCLKKNMGEAIAEDKFMSQKEIDDLLDKLSMD